MDVKRNNEDKEIDIFDEFNNAFGVKTETPGDMKDRLSTESDLKSESDDASKTVVIQSTKSEEVKFKKPAIVNDGYRDLAVQLNVIPSGYRDAKFSEEAIKSNIKNQYENTNRYNIVYHFSDYYNLCVSILNTFRLGMLPTRSYLIGAPNGFGKTSFVNECLITMLQQGYRVAPYISLWELSNLRREAEHRIMEPYESYTLKPEVKRKSVDKYYREEEYYYLKHPKLKGHIPEDSTKSVWGRYSYSEYISADCLFVHFTDVISKDIESHALYQLLSIRGVKGLPTIVLMSTSLEPYENDQVLKEQVWNEILAFKEADNCYDRVYHVSTYTKRSIGLENKDIKIDPETGIVD